MTRSASIRILLAILLLVPVSIQLSRWSGARDDRYAAERLVATAGADANELRRLRAASERRIFGEPPAEDFIDRVNRTLGSIGLPASIAGNITREADRGVAGADDSQRVRVMRIEVQPLSPPDLGRFLAAWRAENPAWTVRQVSLRKTTDRRVGPNEYQVTLNLVARYTSTLSGEPQ